MMKVILLVCVAVVGCASSRPTTTLRVAGISERANELCNGLIDDEIPEVGLNLSAKEVACVKAKAFRRCGAFFLEFVRNVDAGNAAARFSESPKWGTEWCTADFLSGSAEEEEKACRDLPKDDTLLEVAVDEVMEGALSRLQSMASGALKN